MARRKPGDSPPPLYERAVALAARKLRSTQDLRKKLIAEGYDAEGVETALVRLAEVHLLDDQLVAHSLGRRYADRGNQFVVRKLREKGLGAENTEIVLEELPEEIERAVAAARKKLRTMRETDSRIIAQKLYRHLASRGFSGNTVQKVVRQLVRSGDWEMPE